MKPNLPSEVTEGMIRDCRGVPIYLGDLIRTPHFRDKRRVQRWLYHVVCRHEGAMEVMPVERVAFPRKDTGGSCWLHALSNPEGYIAGEVISGYGYGGDNYWADRKRVKP